MNPSIALLPEGVINQIAAGEVIENPASVVKELIDNAIDAGATSIEIAIEGGGERRMAIEDNGCGMGRADVELSLLRHATSKIRAVEDLDALQTMGFRGEALAAIASISRLQIRTSDGREATKLVAEGGVVQAVLPVARNRGTTIEVFDLFFNAPARRKFQKSAQASRAHIARIVETLALAHPEIAFALKVEGKELLREEASGWKERIRAIVGEEFCKEGVWIEEAECRGCLGSSQAVKATRLGQYFFLNRRPIFSPLVARAIKEGYGTRIDSAAHPSFVLYVDCPPTEFDVNVHPQKREVRFRKEGELFGRLRGTVQRAFVPLGESFAAEVHFPLPALPYAMREELPVETSVEGRQEQFVPQGRAIAVIGSFLLAQRDKEVLLVDLAAALEEQLLQRMGRGSQALLWPIEIALSQEEMFRAQELIARCAELDVEARQLGARQICLDALPSWLEPAEALPFFQALKEDLWAGLCARETARLFYRKRARPVALEEAAFLWREGRGREIVLEAADLEGLFARRKR